MSRPLKDLTGKKFGRLTVLLQHGRYCSCVCSCRKLKIISRINLLAGTQSCGCAHYHGGIGFRKSNNKMIEINGVSKPLVEWCREKKRNYVTVHNRICMGWTEKEALNTPTSRKNRKRKKA